MLKCTFLLYFGARTLTGMAGLSKRGWTEQQPKNVALLQPRGATTAKFLRYLSKTIHWIQSSRWSIIKIWQQKVAIARLLQSVRPELRYVASWDAVGRGSYDQVNKRMEKQKRNTDKQSDRAAYRFCCTTTTGVHCSAGIYITVNLQNNATL